MSWLVKHSQPFVFHMAPEAFPGIAVAAEIALALVKKRNLEDSITANLKFADLRERAQCYGAKPKQRRKADIAAALVYELSLVLSPFCVCSSRLCNCFHTSKTAPSPVFQR